MSLKISVWTTCAARHRPWSQKNNKPHRYKLLETPFHVLKQRGNNVHEDCIDNDCDVVIWCGLGIGHDIKEFTQFFLKNDKARFIFYIWDCRAWYRNEGTSLYLHNKPQRHLEKMRSNMSQILCLSKPTMRDAERVLHLENIQQVDWCIPNNDHKPLKYGQREYDFVFIGANHHRRKKTAIEIVDKNKDLKIKIITGDTSEQEKIEIIKNSKFNLNLSTWEGWFYVPAQCAAYGTPLYGTDIQQHLNLQKYARLFSSNMSLDDIVSGAHSLLRECCINQDRYYQMAINCQKLVREKYSEQIFAKNLERIIQNAIR